MDHYGIGTALNGAVRIYFQSARQTGRTTSLVESLKAGDLPVFTNRREADWVKRLCKERGIEIETIIIDPKEPQRIFERGTRPGDGRTIFDHSWVEEYYLNAIRKAQNEIDMFQRDTSGSGMAHIETRLKARELAKWTV
jgi:hypothetical protein